MKKYKEYEEEHKDDEYSAFYLPAIPYVSGSFVTFASCMNTERVYWLV